MTTTNPTYTALRMNHDLHDEMPEIKLWDGLDRILLNSLHFIANNCKYAQVTVVNTTMFFTSA